ncbi:MAG: exported protein of unknown function [Paucimonas sp.]|nr:exported protein of unknown function [Paucimonas sp.]
MTWTGKRLPKVRDGIVGLLSLASIGAAIQAAIGDRIGAAAVLFAAGIVLSLLGNLQRVESFKAFSVEARLRKLDDKIDEADQLLSQIRGASVLMAEISFQMISKVGRWDGIVNKAEALLLADKLVSQLRTCGANEREIQGCIEPWRKINLWDMSRPLYNTVRHFVDLKDQHLRERMQAIPQPIMAGDPLYNGLHAEMRKNGDWLSSYTAAWQSDSARFLADFERQLESIPCATTAERREIIDSVRSRLEAARHYLEHGEFQNRQEWLAEPYG